MTGIGSIVLKMVLVLAGITGSRYNYLRHLVVMFECLRISKSFVLLVKKY